MNLEEEYFAREDIEKVHKLAVKRASELKAKEREALKALHFHHCPNCGMDLHPLKKEHAEVWACFNCQGMWLDKGQLGMLMNEHERFGSRLITAVMNIFERWTPSGKKL